MAKWAGIIAFAEYVETEPGIWTEKITERKYIGDIIRNSRSLGNGSQINDEVYIGSNLSVISDPYISMNFQKIRYVTFMRQKWKCTSVDVEFPRLTLSLGGLYNENKN